MNPLFKGVQANDSKDLVIFLLENMHKELNKLIKNNNQNSREEKADQYNFYNSLTVFIKHFKKNFQSIFSDIFYGMYDSQMKCLNCQIITHNIQLYNILIIPLEEVRKFKNRFENIVTINECLEYYERPEYMSGQNQIFCNKCKQMANSVNSTSLIVGPKVLIINLNREKQLQLDIKINLDEYIDISPFIYYKNTPGKYQLIGVVTNLGSSGISEHFIAFCKSFVDKNWYKYNDSFISLSSLQEAKNIGIPYILFYSIVE
jgi:ubiquitin C-terminal hydrolase